MKLKFNYLLKIFVLSQVFVIVVIQCSEKLLSRKRRFLAFPPGSSFSAAICTTIGQIGNPNVNFISYALNYGISYNLPNETWTRISANGFQNQNPIDTKYVIKRRYRRELYQNIEIAINSMGYNGSDCILRTICETSGYLFGRTGNMIEEIVKTIFSYPVKNVINYEKHHRNVDQRYWDALQIGLKQNRMFKQNELDENVCLIHYPGCRFSLMELAFGKYFVKSKLVNRSAIGGYGFM